VNKSCNTCEWGMARAWIRHVTRMYESCHAYGCIIAHMRTRDGTHAMWRLRMGHVAIVNWSWRTFDSVMAHTCHATPVDESCHTYKWVMTHMWMSHGTHTHESLHTYHDKACGWVMSQICMSRVWSQIWMNRISNVNELSHACDALCSTTAHATRPSPMHLCHSQYRRLLCTHMKRRNDMHTCSWRKGILWAPNSCNTRAGARKLFAIASLLAHTYEKTQRVHTCCAVLGGKV